MSNTLGAEMDQAATVPLRTRRHPRTAQVPVLAALNAFSLILCVVALYVESEDPSQLKSVVLVCWLLWVPGWTISVVLGGRPGTRAIVAVPFSGGVVLAVSVWSLDAQTWDPPSTAWWLLVATTVALTGYLAVAAMLRSADWRHRSNVRLGPGIPDVAPVALAIAGSVAIGTSYRRLDPNTFSSMGLGPALPMPFYIGLGCCALGFLAGVSPARSGRLGAGLNLSVITAVTSSWGALSEPVGSQPIGWLHLGLIRQIEQFGDVIPNYDTRFSWPGFFSGVAFLAQQADVSDLDVWLRFSPAVLGVGATLMVASAAWWFWSGDTDRMLWTALVFQVTNWIGQDYFSPQGVAVVIALAVVVAVLALNPPPHRGGTCPQASLRSQVSTAVVVLLMSIALAPSHQLTPIFLSLWLLGAWVLRRLHNPCLFLIPLVCAFVWFVAGAQDFWRSQLDVLFRDVGAVSNSLSSNLTDRVVTSDGQLAVTVVRLVLTALTIGLAIVGACLLRKKRRVMVGLVGWAFAPYGLLLVQSYGGEMLLRCLLFSLLGASLLAAHSAASLTECLRATRGDDRLWRMVAVPCALTLVSTCAGTVLVRGGNDGFNGFSSQDLRAVQLAYDVTRPGDTMYGLTAYAPFRSERIGSVRQVSLERKCPVTTLDVGCVADSDAVVVFSNPAQENYGVIRKGMSPGWSRRLTDALVARGAFRKVVDEGQVVVLRRVVLVRR